VAELLDKTGVQIEISITKVDPPIQRILEKVHIDIIGPMPAKSVGGREYAYTVVEGYTLVVYTRPLQLKSEAADAFKSFRETENKSGSRLRAVMTDNMRKLSMGGVRDICEQDGIKLHTLHRLG